MSVTRLLSLVCAAAGAALLAGCASSGGSSMSRIDANREAYESWPLDVREAVLEQRVINGMTAEQVEMARGKPTEKVVRNGRKGLEEIWIYRKGGPSMLNNVTLGTAIGGVGAVVQPGGGGGYVEEEEVVFINGEVVRSTLPQ